MTKSAATMALSVVIAMLVLHAHSQELIPLHSWMEMPEDQRESSYPF